MSIPCSATTDTKCSRCSTCDFPEQYESERCSPSHNRACRFVSDCNSSSFQFLPPTLTTDRVCKLISGMSSNQSIPIMLQYAISTKRLSLHRSLQRQTEFVSPSPVLEASSNLFHQQTTRHSKNLIHLLLLCCIRVCQGVTSCRLPCISDYYPDGSPCQCGFGCHTCNVRGSDTECSRCKVSLIFSSCVCFRLTNVEWSLSFQREMLS